MKRPAVTKKSLSSKVAEGNLIHWLHYLKEDFDRFVIENRDLMTQEQKLAVVDISDYILRAIEDDAAKDLIFGRSGSDYRTLHCLHVAVAMLNSETVEEALTKLYSQEAFSIMAGINSSERIETLRTHLQTAVGLIGSDTDDVDPEYARGISEFVCMTSGISTEHKDVLAALVVRWASTSDPDLSVNVFIRDMKVRASRTGLGINVLFAAVAEEIDLSASETPE